MKNFRKDWIKEERGLLNKIFFNNENNKETYTICVYCNAGDSNFKKGHVWQRFKLDTLIVLS